MAHNSHDTTAKLSGRVLASLSKLGWNSRYHPAIDQYLAELSDHGFTINPVARQILESFAGCRFNFPDGAIAWISFTITEARHTFKPEFIANRESLIGEPGPCPVAAGGGYVLFAFPSGKVALLQEQWFCLVVANSFADVVEAMKFNDCSRCREVPNVGDYSPDNE